MVPKRARLPREEFRTRGYKAKTTAFFSLKAKKNERDTNRIAVIIGKSVDKRAARRNFLERKAKAELLGVKHAGEDIILTIFPKANQLSTHEFIAEIKKILSKTT